MPPGSVLLFWSIIIYHRSIMIYFDRHVIFSFRYAIWMVDHNWLAVDHDLPFCVLPLGRSWFTLIGKSFFTSYISYERSIILDRRSILIYLSCIFSVKIVFFPSVMVHERSIIIYLAHQRSTFFTKKLKNLPDVAQSYVR